MATSPPFLTAHIVLRWMNKKENSINIKKLKVRWRNKKKRQNNFNFHQFKFCMHNAPHQQRYEVKMSQFEIPFIVHFSFQFLFFTFISLFFISFSKYYPGDVLIARCFLTFDDYSIFSTSSPTLQLHYSSFRCTFGTCAGVYSGEEEWNEKLKNKKT